MHKIWKDIEYLNIFYQAGTFGIIQFYNKNSKTYILRSYKQTLFK